MGPAIRDLFPSLRGRSLLARRKDRELELIDGVTLQTRSRFAATIDLTGFATVDDAGTICIVSIWERHGIAGYDPRTGQEVWRRKDLKKFQRLSLTADAARVCCTRFEGSAAVLDAGTGDTLETLKGLKAIWNSPYNGLSLVEHRSGLLELRTNGKVVGSLRQPEKELACAAFSPGSVVYGKVCGATWCVDAATAQPRWMYTPPLGAHTLALTFRPDLDAFFAIEFAFDAEARASGFPRHGSRVIRFDHRGQAEVVGADAEHIPVAFARDGAVVICDTGAAFDTSTGKQVGCVSAASQP